MCLPNLQAVPYQPDSANLFSAIADRPWSVFLDSGKPGSVQGRYDIIAAEPVAKIVTIDGVTRVTSQDSNTASTETPFNIIRQALGKKRDTGSLPFAGGAIGYIGYSQAKHIAGLPEISNDPTSIPDLCFGIYDWALIVDHLEKKTWLVRQPDSQITNERWNEYLSIFSKANSNSEPPVSFFKVNGAIRSNLTKQQYATAFNRIKKYIYDGDCYQVNFAQKFSTSCSGDPWQAYKSLRQINPSPFGAYLNTPYGQVLSSSPERFLKLDRGVVETKPIKGTRPRSSDFSQDKKFAEELDNSQKDRAENLMIVDLLRNDLGKSCEPGSIEVPWLFRVESFSRVHHLVSKIIGKLAPGTDAVSLLLSCFPGGSITGAPKYRAMEIIEELEPDPRGIYCGSIGYIGFDGNMDTNISIRTMLHQDGNIHFSAGGGIIADSSMESEYQETFDKVSAMLDLLNDNLGHTK